jgi:chromosome partitioning protein
MVGRRYRLTQDMRNAASALRLPVAKIALTLRQVYADAPGQGVVVWQLGSRAREASRQIRSLFRELLPQTEKARAKPKVKIKPKSQVKPKQAVTA